MANWHPKEIAEAKQLLESALSKLRQARRRVAAVQLRVDVVAELDNRLGLAQELCERAGRELP